MYRPDLRHCPAALDGLGDGDVLRLAGRRRSVSIAVGCVSPLAVLSRRDTTAHQSSDVMRCYNAAPNSSPKKHKRPITMSSSSCVVARFALCCTYHSLKKAHCGSTYLSMKYNNGVHDMPDCA